jgi:hypothetical protein
VPGPEEGFVIIVSGGLLVAAAVLLVVGVLGPTACVYASLAAVLLAAALLPLGALRRMRRAHGRPAR